MTARSFGRPEPAEKTKAIPDEQMPVPVLHVGEVHAELRLTVSDDTLRDLGSQIASMLATAAKQGFEYGMRAAMEEMDGEGGEDGEELPEPRRRNVQVDLSNASMPASELHLSEKDIERLGRQR